MSQLVSRIINFAMIKEMTPANWIVLPGNNLKKQFKVATTTSPLPRYEGLEVVTMNGDCILFQLGKDNSFSYEIFNNSLVKIEGNVLEIKGPPDPFPS